LTATSKKKRFLFLPALTDDDDNVVAIRNVLRHIARCNKSTAMSYHAGADGADASGTAAYCYTES
jgi:hypothetical protein